MSVFATLRHYWRLMKPRPTILACIATLWGYYMGLDGAVDFARAAHLCVGCLFVGGGAAALNQYIERNADKRMKRTEERPLPGGHVRSGPAFVFAVLISILGIAYLVFFVNLLAASVAVVMHLCYSLAYTLLKSRTSLSAYVGAVAGALPPVLGWAGARATLDVGGWVLFCIIFFWQFPHIYAIGWLYRDDYARGGMRTLASEDVDGKRTSNHIAFTTLLTLLASLAPYGFGMTGRVYLLAATSLGAAFLVLAAFMTPDRLGKLSRKFIIASVVYLPALIVLMAIDKR